MTDPAPSSPASELVAIAAVCANRVIGGDGDQPWHHRDDFARFKRLTMGQVLLMGRKTFTAIGRPLPGRHTVVLTRDADWSAAGADAVPDLDAALALAGGRWPEATVFIAGGGEIYRLALPRTIRLELTEVERDCPGDVTFPTVDPAVWREVAREPREGFAWVTYARTS